MKIFMSSDIEGTCGICDWSETNLGDPGHDYFRRQMSKEVAAAAGGAIASGATDILIKDAHDSARNIIPELLPKEARLIRGWTKNFYCMMAGIDSQKFDAVMMTGYHSAARQVTSPLAHTMTRRLESFKINGELAGEFTINAYIAGYFGVPVCFISGDKGICEEAKALIPDIIAVPVQEGLGAATISLNSGRAIDLIRAGAEEATADEYYKKCQVNMPEAFEIQVGYQSHIDAYKNSFYPGVIQIAPKKIRFKSTNFVDVLRLVHFCVNN